MAYHPKFTVTPHLIKIIEEISVLREKILSATVEVPWIPTLQKEARVRNTHSSTAIEGNPLTLEEVRRLEEGKDLPTATERARREVLNYFAGLRFVEKNALKKIVTREDVLKLHAITAKGVMDQGSAGVYRSIQVRVGNYIPPPPGEVPSLMAELLEWWNNESSGWTPVISSAVLHYRFEEIHPFADGNGRIGRFLALWELYRRGFDTYHIFSVDEVYWENRPRYYQALSQVSLQHGDLTGWLEFAAEAIHVTLERVWVRTKDLARGREGQKIILSARQERLLVVLREKRSLSPREIWEACGLTKQGALNLLKPLLEAGLIRRVGTRKSGRYVIV